MKMQAFRRQSARIKLSSDTPEPLVFEAEQTLNLAVPAEGDLTNTSESASINSIATNAAIAAEPTCSTLAVGAEPELSPPSLDRETKAIAANEQTKAQFGYRFEKLLDEFSKDKYELWHWALGSGLIIVLLQTPSWVLNLAICSAVVAACYFAYKQPQAFVSNCFRLCPIVFSWATLIKLAIAYCAQIVLTNLVYSVPHLILWLPN
ncbi:MAG: hypothetical protein C0508_25320, partial [Cyanobacteria bacterium PR.023]|nr:hypothetical protein [Cyanobacteria bacterium PR.023]